MAGNSAPGTKPPSESSLKRRPTKPLPERIKWFVRIPWFGRYLLLTCCLFGVMLVIWGVLDVLAPFLNLGCLFSDVLLIFWLFWSWYVFSAGSSTLEKRWKVHEIDRTCHPCRDWYSKWSFWITSESLRSALLKRCSSANAGWCWHAKTTAGLIIICFNCFICGLSSAGLRTSSHRADCYNANAPVCEHVEISLNCNFTLLIIALIISFCTWPMLFNTCTICFQGDWHAVVRPKIEKTYLNKNRFGSNSDGPTENVKSRFGTFKEYDVYNHRSFKEIITSWYLSFSLRWS